MKTALAPKATPLSMSVPLLTPPCTKTSHFGCIFAKHYAILCKIEIGEEADAKWFFSVIHIALAPDSAAWSASLEKEGPSKDQKIYLARFSHLWNFWVFREKIFDVFRRFVELNAKEPQSAVECDKFQTQKSSYSRIFVFREHSIDSDGSKDPIQDAHKDHKDGKFADFACALEFLVH